MAEHRCGFVSILGRPNAGKSTLINRMVGEKVAIVADKPQTTRTLIQGVVNVEGAQIVLLDTPGLHEAETRISRRMMEAAQMAMQERELLLFVVDAKRPFNEGDPELLERIFSSRTPVFLVLNKIDLVEPKSRLLDLLTRYQPMPFAEFLMVSAETGEGVDELVRLIAGRLPEGVAVFPEDYWTDQPERFLAAELVREKVLQQTHEEVPHSVTVWVEEFTDKPQVTFINATILVEREGQKKIVIGTGGQRIKAIGAEARQDIERMLGRKVYLELFVKVRENWKESPEYLNTIDWRTQMTSRTDDES